MFLTLYISLTQEEFRRVCEEREVMRNLVSSVMFSRDQNGKIVKEFAGIHQEGAFILKDSHADRLRYIFGFRVS